MVRFHCSANCFLIYLLCFRSRLVKHRAGVKVN